MQTVWKFPLDLAKSTGFVKAPAGTVFMSVGWQQVAQLVMWGLVPDDEAPLTDRVWEVVGTGRVRLLENLGYIGTAQDQQFPGNPLVLHVFADGA